MKTVSCRIFIKKLFCFSFIGSVYTDRSCHAFFLFFDSPKAWWARWKAEQIRLRKVEIRACRWTCLVAMKMMMVVVIMMVMMMMKIIIGIMHEVGVKRQWKLNDNCEMSMKTKWQMWNVNENWMTYVKCQWRLNDKCEMSMKRKISYIKENASACITDWKTFISSCLSDGERYWHKRKDFRKSDIIYHLPDFQNICILWR